jgi:hypothetical protein
METKTQKRNVVDPSAVPAIAAEGEQSAVLVQTSEVAFYNTMMKLAVEIHSSAMFPQFKNKGQVLVGLLMGHAHGIHPVSALSHVTVIKDKVGIDGYMIGAALESSGVTWDVLETTAERCKIELHKGDRKSLVYEWTTDDAKRAGKLPGKDGSAWKHYPQDMLYWRALTAGGRRFSPAALMGLRLKDELTDIKEVPSAASVNDEPPISPEAMSAGDPDSHQGYDDDKAPQMADQENTAPAEPEESEKTPPQAPNGAQNRSDGAGSDIRSKLGTESLKDLVPYTKERLIAIFGDEADIVFEGRPEAYSEFVEQQHATLNVTGDVSDLSTWNKGQLANLIINLRTMAETATKQQSLSGEF